MNAAFSMADEQMGKIVWSIIDFMCAKCNSKRSSGIIGYIKLLLSDKTF
ncbi:MAG: hypothetical protein PUD64_04285 [Bacteroidales bacterium]|nr:hypothetical protein [Bacteroidales bacterium]